MPIAHAQRATRRDSLRNQQLVLDAARDVLSVHGTEATMELIAARAGVGIGTVYRHFPNKQALVDALVTAILVELNTAAATAAEHGGSGLEEFLRVLARSFATHRGYARMLAGSIHATSGADNLRSMIAQLLRQAREHGDVGPDIALGDVMCTIWALRGIIETSGATTASAWERHLDIHLAALRSPQIPSAHPPLTTQQLATIAARSP